MDAILEFLANNYLWFMIGAGVLLLALIGFLVDSNKKKKMEQMTPMTSSDPVVPGPVMPTTEPTSVPVEQNSMDAVQTEPVAEEPSLVFEEPSLQNNNGQNISFEEPVVESNEQSVIPSTSIFDTPNDEQTNSNVIGEPITMEAPVTQEPVIVEPVVSQPVNVEPVVEIPSTPIAQEVQPVENIMSAPTMDNTVIPQTPGSEDNNSPLV